MRVAIYLALVAAALAAFTWGALVPALALGGVKAALVGVGYMELHHAHPAHRVGFVLGVALLVGVLALVAR